MVKAEPDSTCQDRSQSPVLTLLLPPELSALSALADITTWNEERFSFCTAQTLT